MEQQWRRDFPIVEYGDDTVVAWTCRCGYTGLPNDFVNHAHYPEPYPFYLLSDGYINPHKETEKRNEPSE